MSDTKSGKSLMVVSREHFGYLPGQTLKEFAAEMQQLTPQDRKDLQAEFAKIGIDVILPAEKES